MNLKIRVVEHQKTYEISIVASIDKPVLNYRVEVFSFFDEPSRYKIRFFRNENFSLNTFDEETGDLILSENEILVTDLFLDGFEIVAQNLEEVVNIVTKKLKYHFGIT